MTKASNTRHNILEKAFDLIYKKGYQTTSVDEILATTQVTKGAFYYHFNTKDEMGIAIIREIVQPIMQKALIEPLQHASQPIEQIYQLTADLLLDNPFLQLEYGCPAGNLTQEMAPWNVEFSKALNEIIVAWQTAIEAGINVAILKGHIRKDVNPKQVAYFVISSYWGIRNFGKIYNDTACYHAYLKELKLYLGGLK